MAIGDDFSVAANGDIRHTSGTSTYTVLEFHRWLGDLADDATATGDDLVAISTQVPSDRAYDALITLNDYSGTSGPTYNIDATAAEYLYAGTIIQDGGDEVWSGLRVVGSVETGTELQIVQNGSILTSYWGTGLNDGGGTLLQILVQSRTAGADIDGKRVRVFAREVGDTYDEFEVTLSAGGVETAAISTASDINYQTGTGTIAGWTITNTEGYRQLDITGDGSDEDYYSEWNLGVQDAADLYEHLKYDCRRGTATPLYGLNGALFRGVTHEVVVDTPSGTFSAVEAISWSGGTGQMLAINSTTAPTKLWMQLLTGVAPTDGQTITGGTSAATCAVNVTVTARTLNKQLAGTSTGTALIGAYGLGVDPADTSAADSFTDLDNTVRNPPNNVQFNVTNLISGDRVFVGPASGGALDKAQLSLNTTLSGAAETSVVVTTTIPTDTPSSGTLRVTTDGGVDKLLTYTSFTGSTFTISSSDFSTDNATAANDVYITYIDTTTSSTSESFTVVYASDRDLIVRVRRATATIIKPFETAATLGSAGGSVAAVRTAD